VKPSSNGVPRKRLSDGDLADGQALCGEKQQGAIFRAQLVDGDPELAQNLSEFEVVR
jgi:hypothetical protein